MPRVPVTRYGVEWNPALNTGRLFVQIGGGQPTELRIESADELVAVMLMMSKSGVLFDTAGKDFELPLRPVGT